MGAKELALKGLRASMDAAYAIMKLFSRRHDRVVFLSRQSDTPSADFLLLADKIRQLSPSTETVFSCRLGLKSEMGLSYIPLLLRQMHLLAGARACVTESYIPAVSMLHHRSGMTVTQIWHSMVAIKKFGWQTVDTPEGSSLSTARLMNMHRGYDHIISGSEYMIKYFAEAMDTDADKIYPLGAAHADTILSAESTRAAVSGRYLQTAGKKLVVYLPTMRRGEAIDCLDLTENFDFERGSLIVSLHPLDRDTVINDGRVITDAPFTTAELILAADAVISDYSGAAAEASLRNIPVYFYVPDFDRYSSRCGVNLDPREVFPELTFTDGKALCGALFGAPDPDTVKREREYLAGGCDGHSTDRIARLVLYGKAE